HVLVLSVLDFDFAIAVRPLRGASNRNTSGSAGGYLFVAEDTVGLPPGASVGAGVTTPRHARGDGERCRKNGRHPPYAVRAASKRARRRRGACCCSKRSGRVRLAHGGRSGGSSRCWTRPRIGRRRTR